MALLTMGLPALLLEAGPFAGGGKGRGGSVPADISPGRCPVAFHLDDDQ